MVRVNGQIMTDVRYSEMHQAELGKDQQGKQRKHRKSLMSRLNLYFFEQEEISISDWLWFYGMFFVLLCMTVGTLLFTKIWV